MSTSIEIDLLTKPSAAPDRPLPEADAPSDRRCVDRMLDTLDQAEAALEDERTEAERTEAEPLDAERLDADRRAHQPEPAKQQRLGLSVLIPVYNERETIREIVRRVRAAEQHDEIVIVDDCSTDGTRDVLLELDRAEDIRVILHGYNKGKGGALRTALGHARGDVVLVQDADLEYDPSDYPKLLAPI
ncbi:MAG: glycosyltransferase family 2 protein, partial [Planctomycetota bacterium]